MKKAPVIAGVAAGVCALVSVPVAVLAGSRRPKHWSVEHVDLDVPLRRIDGSIAPLAWTISEDGKAVLVQFVSSEYAIESVDAAYTKSNILTLEVSAVLLPLGSLPRESAFRLAGADPLAVEQAVVLRHDANGVSGEDIPFLYAMPDVAGV